MAGADYRHCDVCGCKVFYDSNLNYEWGKNIPPEECIRDSPGMKLDYLGDWAVICRDCAKTHVCAVIAKSDIDA